MFTAVQSILSYDDAELTAWLMGWLGHSLSRTIVPKRFFLFLFLSVNIPRQDPGGRDGTDWMVGPLEPR